MTPVPDPPVVLWGGFPSPSESEVRCYGSGTVSGQISCWWRRPFGRGLDVLGVLFSTFWTHVITTEGASRRNTGTGSVRMRDPGQVGKL